MTTTISANDATLTPLRNAPAVLERRMRGTSGPLARRRRTPEENAEVATAAPERRQEVADERGGREHRPRRNLADSDRVEQLRLGEPVQPIDQIGAQEREQHIATAEEHGAHLRNERNRGSEL